MPSKLLYGYYSTKQELDINKFYTYKTPNGGMAIVTEVTHIKKPQEDLNRLQLQFVCMVTDYISTTKHTIPFCLQ